MNASDDAIAVQGTDTSSVDAGAVGGRAGFIGRDSYVLRYRARLEHFRFSLLFGLPGIGKTALLLKLAEEARSTDLGFERVVYLQVQPGEGVVSLLGRLEVRLLGHVRQVSERQSDSFRRLVDLLAVERVLLLVDDLHRWRREDAVSFLRTVNSTEGDYRVLAAARPDLDLSAMDRAAIYVDSLRPLRPEVVAEIAEAAGVNAQTVDALRQDAIRGGSSSHPLTLHCMLTLLSNELPPTDFLQGLTARSINSFKAIWQLGCDREVSTHKDGAPRFGLSSSERDALHYLALLSYPLDATVASKVFGDALGSLIQRRLLEVIDGEIYLHSVVAQAIVQEEQVSILAVDVAVAQTIAEHFRELQGARCEPMGMIRSAELLARAGEVAPAIDSLDRAWGGARDFGFHQAYLKSLASIPEPGDFAERVQVLSARARMHHGHSTALSSELLALSESQDIWTSGRALAALVYVHRDAGDHRAVVESFSRLEQVCDEPDVLLELGTVAATAMMKIESVEAAEQLARRLLGLLDGRREPERKGQMHRLIARVCAQGGRLEEAIKEASGAADCYEEAGDHFHAASARGYIGDLYRERGEFEKAKESFDQFLELARRWGDRNLVHIAELSEAWVLLDIGNLAQAAKLIDEVDNAVSGATGKRLRRYLLAAKALLAAGRGQHDEAIKALPAIISSWERVYHGAVADLLRAQYIRSLIAIGDLDAAREEIDSALKRSDPKTAAPRVAMFLRESAILRLRRKDGERAMKEFSRARTLFGKGGNRREEALTLHRIAHAAVDEGDLKLARKRADECLELAKQIKHARAIALAQEVRGRILLLERQSTEAMTVSQEAMQSLRRLGDDVGSLHSSEVLLRASVISGDLSGAIRLGPRVSSHAEKLGIREVRIRAIILTGMALLKKGRMEAATRCFREIPIGVLQPITGALMWRLGEALGAANGDSELESQARENWVSELSRQRNPRRDAGVLLLSELGLPPRHRCQFIDGTQEAIIGSEAMAILKIGDYKVLVDGQRGIIHDAGERYLIPPMALPLAVELARTAGKVVSFARATEITSAAAAVAAAALGAALDLESAQAEGVDEANADAEPPEATSKDSSRDSSKGVGGKRRGKTSKKAVKSAATKEQDDVAMALDELVAALEGAANVKIKQTATGIKMLLPKSSACLIPLSQVAEGINPLQKQLIGLLGQCGKASLQRIQDTHDVSRTVARREITDLVSRGYVEAIRDGRGQAYQLA